MKSFPRRLLGLLLPVVLALPACQTPETPPQPATLVPKGQMVLLLADLHLLEARVEDSRLPTDSAQALFQTEQKNLFWKYDTTDSTFRRSYRYYSIHGKDLDDIYGVVLDSLKKRQARFGVAEAAKVTEALKTEAAKASAAKAPADTAKARPAAQLAK